MDSAQALNTRLTYQSAWKLFTQFCETTQLCALPAERQTVLDFATWCLAIGRRIASVSIYIGAIRFEHVSQGLESPCAGLYGYLERARRDLKETSGAKAALTYEQVRRMAQGFGEDKVSIRNRAMILLAFASGWRRSEIVALRYDHIRFVEHGIELYQAFSKTDQFGKGRTVGVHQGRRKLTCPVLAVRAWLAVRGDWEGPLFCSFDRQREMTREPLHRKAAVLYLAVKAAVAHIGLDERRYGAHSLRAGMVTEAAKNGASEMSIMQRTGHTSSVTLRKYIRPATAFDFNPMKGVL